MGYDSRPKRDLGLRVSINLVIDRSVLISSWLRKIGDTTQWRFTTKPSECAAGLTSTMKANLRPWLGDPLEAGLSLFVQGMDD